MLEKSESNIIVYDANGVLIDNIDFNYDYSKLDTPNSNVSFGNDKLNDLLLFLYYLLGKHLNIYPNYKFDSIGYSDNKSENMLAYFLLNTDYNVDDYKILIAKLSVFGSNIVGVHNACYFYFGKSFNDINSLELNFLNTLRGERITVTDSYIKDYLNHNEESNNTHSFMNKNIVNIVQFVLNDLCDSLNIEYTDLDSYINGRTMKIKTSLSIEVNSILESSNILSSVVIDNSNGLVRGIKVSEESEISINTYIKAKDIISNIADKLPLYNVKNNLPDKIINNKTLATIKTTVDFPTVPDKVKRDILDVVNNSVYDATTLLDSCAMYSMLTRDGLFIKPSSIVEVRIDNETVYTRTSIKTTRIYGNRASSLLLESLSGKAISESFAIYISNKFTLCSVIDYEYGTQTIETVYNNLVNNLNAKPIRVNNNIFKEERNKMLLHNTSIFKQLFESEFKTLSNISIKSKKDAISFNTLYSELDSLIDSVDPIVEPNVSVIYRSKLNELRRSRNSELLKYVV